MVFALRPLETRHEVSANSKELLPRVAQCSVIPEGTLESHDSSWGDELPRFVPVVVVLQALT
jgi:hypothetical protein